MKIRSAIIALIVASQCYVSALFCETKGLIITIDQKHLAGVDTDTLKMLPAILSKLDVKNIGSLGEVITLFKGKIYSHSTVKDVITAWDDSRAQWIENKAKATYNNVYLIKGDDLRQDQKMKDAWEQALRDNDVVDYVSMVHQGDQFIKDAWQVSNTKKLRMVYSEACCGGSGKDHFILKHRAALSAGHKGKSASPLFSLTFIHNWLDGNNFVASFQDAWSKGQMLLNTQGGLILASMIGGYTDKEEIVRESKIAVSFHPGVDGFSFTINSNTNGKEDKFTGNDVIEFDIE